MNVQSMRGNVDQPFVRALGVSSGDRIYVGVNDFNQSNGQTATIDVSVDGGATYKSVRIERRKTAGQDGPSVRPAVANDGTVYAAFCASRKTPRTRDRRSPPPAAPTDRPAPRFCASQCEPICTSRPRLPIHRWSRSARSTD